MQTTQPLNVLNGDVLHTTSEAADILRCSISTLWRLRRDGKLKYSTVGGRVLIKKSSLEELLEKNMEVVHHG